MGNARLQINTRGWNWEMRRPADLESIWEEMDDGSRESEEDFIPYWVEIWPAAVSLSGWLLENADSLKGALCLDLGCGLGLSAMAGLHCGARVAAVDNSLSALHYARENAHVNRVQDPMWICMDWGRCGFVQSCFDFVWAADIFYEERFLQPVSNLLQYVLKTGGKAVFADPDRETSRRVWSLLRERGWEVRVLESEKVQSCGQNAEVVLRMLQRRSEANSGAMEET